MFQLGRIDLTKKPQRPHIFIAKPNRTVISKVSEAFNIQNVIKLGSINELTFSVPYQVLNNDMEYVRNRNIELLKVRYLVKFVIGDATEWYLITKTQDSSNDGEDILTVTCMSLPYELRDKQIKTFTTKNILTNIDTPINCTTALERALEETLWAVDYVDGVFDTQFRTFDTGGSVLDIVIKIAETFKGVLEWDTINRKVSMKQADLIGVNRGLTLSYNNYLKSLSREYNSDEMVTRLKVFGRDGLSIQRINPTGANYIEDFSYFMYPFQRNPVTKQTIRSSYYMSDELCHAILDYNELIESKRGIFENLTNERKIIYNSLLTRETELFEIEVSRNIARDNQDVQHAMGTINKLSTTYNGSTQTLRYTLKSGKRHAVMLYASSTAGLNINYNGQLILIPSNTWTVIAKKDVQSNTTETITVFGSVSNVVVRVLTVEISQSENVDSLIIEKYCAEKWDLDYNNKLTEIEDIVTQLNEIDELISNLRQEIAIENNFSPELIRERNLYIIEKEWTDTNYIDDERLYADAVKMFEKMREPQTIIDIDIVNFLEVVEAQRDWDKLNLGDIITIKYERMGVLATAKIIEVAFDFENSGIRLTIANTKDVESDEDKLIKMLYKSISSSTTVDMNKFKWDGAAAGESELRKLLEAKWDATKREIEAGVNESVTINARGITILDPTDPNRFLRATHGVLAITNDGGNSFKHAITAEGIVAERLYGQIIFSEQLTLGDQDGILQIQGNKIHVKDRDDNIVLKIGMYDNEKFGLQAINSIGKTQVIIDKDDGFKIMRLNGTIWDDVAWLDTDGRLHLKDIFATGTIEASTLSATVQLKVNNIDIMSLIYDAGGLKDHIQWVDGTMIVDGNIEARHIKANSITAQQIDTSTLIVGTNIQMGPNAVISWNNVTNKPGDLAYLSDLHWSNIIGKPTNLATINDINWNNVKGTVITQGGISTEMIVAVNGWVKNAHIESVSADKITTGTLDASKITVTNLYVKRLYSQYSNDDYLQLDNIYGDLILISGNAGGEWFRIYNDLTAAVFRFKGTNFLHTSGSETFPRGTWTFSTGTKLRIAGGTVEGLDLVAKFG